MKARKTIMERPHADDRGELLLESSLSVVKAAAKRAGSIAKTAVYLTAVATPARPPARAARSESLMPGDVPSPADTSLELGAASVTAAQAAATMKSTWAGSSRSC
jgi:hypothetical protein